MEGYIKLHRQLLESPYFDNPNYLKIWVWLLLKAQWKPGDISLKVSNGYTTVHLERGQLLFGRNKAEEVLGIDSSMIYRCLKKFENDESISIKSNSQYSIVTICKYDDYNEKEIVDEQRTNSGRTADEQPMNTYKKDKKEKNINILKDIVEYLNSKTNKSFQYTSQATQTCINARIREGFKIDHFKKVIDTKVKQWKEDERMSAYLRPSTLFGTKFESYLNETPILKLETQEPTEQTDEYKKFVAEFYPKREIDRGRLAQ